VKRILISTAVLLVAGAFVFIAVGASQQSAAGTYKIVLDDAFGLVQGADFKVAGVPAGTIKSIDLCKSVPDAHCQSPLNALVTVQVTQNGFGQFHRDATCKSRPQSLIGEYYVDCDPGTRGSPTIKPGATIPITHTQSVIPADLLQNVLRLPYRQRFTLIINELGAAAAARSDDLQAALHRAVPALDETDNLLNLLANDSKTIQNLTRDSNTVITALANNSANVNRFIEMANRTAVATSAQDQNLRLTFQNLPPLLEQLRPSMSQLSATLAANTPVLQNLNAGATQIDRFLTDVPPFANSARPALRFLGQASVTGKVAVKASTPLIAHLNKFAKPTPELAQNLAIVLHDLDDQGRAVEPDPRSPGGRGFSGLQALLGYVFNQALAINYYGPLGHMLGVDAFINNMCAPYATPATVSMALKQYGPRYRQCYSFLGPDQPGVTTTDPSNPGAAIPDPGGGGPVASSASAAPALDVSHVRRSGASSGGSGSGSTSASTAKSAGGSNSSSGANVSSSGPAINLPKSVGQILNGTGSRPTAKPSSNSTSSSTSSSSSSTTSAPSAPAPASTGSSGGNGSGGQTQALLNYLLTP
jgi:virulence factor Mce-like protein